MGGISLQLPLLNNAELPLLAAATGRITYDWARFQSYTERWHYLVLGLLVAAIVAFVVVMYRRDSVELRPAWASSWLLYGSSLCWDCWPITATWSGGPSGR